MKFPIQASLSLWTFILSLAGCGDDFNAAEPDAAICLYELATCSSGSLGYNCPPAASDFTTHCIDIPYGGCVAAGQESEFNRDIGQTFYTYTSNPRIVEGVTCEDYTAMPGVDPDPLTPGCEYENDGTCDAPGVCPAGTDVADCEVPTCDPVSPDPDDCKPGAFGAVWCANLDGGDACSEGANIYVCQGGSWVLANHTDALDACLEGGFSTYYGCVGPSDDYTLYCE